MNDKTLDPYVKIKLNIPRKDYKSTIKNKTLNPEWNEEFKFDLNTEQISDPLLKLRFKLYDDDKDSKVDFMGSGFLGQSQIYDYSLNSPLNEHQIKLINKNIQ